MIPIMPAMGMGSYAYVDPNDPQHARLIADAKAEQEVCRKLADALYEYLAFSVNRRLASINDPPPRPRVSIEDLNRVQEKRERLLKRIERRHDIRHFLNLSLDLAFLDPLKQQLEYADRQISAIQTELGRGAT